MKILVDAHCFDNDGQGIVSYIQGLYEELLKNPSIEVTFACSNPEKIRTFFSRPVNTLKIPHDASFYRLAIFFPRILKSGEYDYVHFQYILPFFLNKKSKYITTIHDIIPIDFPEFYSITYRLKVKIFFRRAAKKSHYIFTVSEYSRKRIHERFHVPLDKIGVTCNAVKKIYSNNISNQKKEKKILYVSRIEKRKNHLLLLRVFIEKKWFKTHTLIFVGTIVSKNKDFFHYFNKLSTEQKSKIIFLDGISDDELKKQYINAELFIYPSFAEGFGIPPLEAAIMNLKVICSNTTAMVDFDFFEKYSFHPNDLEQLHEQIRRILLDDEYPFETIKNEIFEKYNWEQSAQQFLKHLNSSETI